MSVPIPATNGQNDRLSSTPNATELAAPYGASRASSPTREPRVSRAPARAGRRPAPGAAQAAASGGSGGQGATAPVSGAEEKRVLTPRRTPAPGPATPPARRGRMNTAPPPPVPAAIGRMSAPTAES